MTRASEDAWVELDRVYVLMEAQVIRSALSAHGFDVLIPEEQMAGTMGGGVLTGGIRILVRADDETPARRLLAELQQR